MIDLFIDIWLSKQIQKTENLYLDKIIRYKYNILVILHFPLGGGDIGWSPVTSD